MGIQNFKFGKSNRETRGGRVPAIFSEREVTAKYIDNKTTLRNHIHLLLTFGEIDGRYLF